MINDKKILGENKLDDEFFEILGKNDEEHLEKIFNFIEIISKLETNSKISSEKNEILNHKLKYEVKRNIFLFIYFRQLILGKNTMTKFRNYKFK